MDNPRGLDVFFASPTARGGATMVRTRLRQLLTGAVLEKSFARVRFAEPTWNGAGFFLYSDAHGFHFMDEKNYEQFTFPPTRSTADRGYLKEGVSLGLEGQGAPFPCNCRIRRTRSQLNELGLRGDTAAGGAPSRLLWKTASRCASRFSSRKAKWSALHTQTGEVAGRA